MTKVTGYVRFMITDDMITEMTKVTGYVRFMITEEEILNNSFVDLVILLFVII